MSDTNKDLDRTTILPSRNQLIEKVPLIKSPSFWIPKPVELPLDIHPLPEDIKAYFVYPHTLEPHILSILPQQLNQLQSNHSQRVQFLASLVEEQERARKALLNQVAPGWNEGGGVMEPVRKEMNSSAITTTTGGARETVSGGGSITIQTGGEVSLLDSGITF